MFDTHIAKFSCLLFVIYPNLLSECWISVVSQLSLSVPYFAEGGVACRNATLQLTAYERSSEKRKAQ